MAFRDLGRVEGSVRRLPDRTSSCARASRQWRTRCHPREQGTSRPVGPWRRVGAYSSPPRGAPIASSERLENERPNKLASQSACTAFAIALRIRSKLDPVRFPRAGSFDSSASEIFHRCARRCAGSIVAPWFASGAGSAPCITQGGQQPQRVAAINPVMHQKASEEGVHLCPPRERLGKRLSRRCVPSNGTHPWERRLFRQPGDTKEQPMRVRSKVMHSRCGFS
jgi:hypothetical protein